MRVGGRFGVARPLGLALAGACLLLGARSGGGAGPSPAVYLFESRPIETRIGNPELEDASRAWQTEIAAAQKRLDLEEYYLSDLPGESLHPVLDEIGRAASRGVNVRLLLDSRMKKYYPQPADSLS